MSAVLEEINIMKTKYLDPQALPDWVKTIFTFTFGNDNHWGYVKEWGTGYVMKYFSRLATWDSNQLTKLVLIAHKVGVRVEIMPINTNFIGILVHKLPKDPTDVRPTAHHPTLKQLADLAERLTEF